MDILWAKGNLEVGGGRTMYIVHCITDYIRTRGSVHTLPHHYCDNTFKSENGLKIHVGKSHKNLNSTPATPDCLRQQPGSSVSLSASPLLDTSREESSPTSPISGVRFCTCSNLKCCGCYHDDSCECRQTNKITAFCDCEDVDPSHGDCNKQFKTK